MKKGVKVKTKNSKTQGSYLPKMKVEKLREQSQTD